MRSRSSYSTIAAMTLLALCVIMFFSALRTLLLVASTNAELEQRVADGMMAGHLNIDSINNKLKTDGYDVTISEGRLTNYRQVAWAMFNLPSLERIYAQATNNLYISLVAILSISAVIIIQRFRLSSLPINNPP
jgi:hypothetical protein